MHLRLPNGAWRSLIPRHPFSTRSAAASSRPTSTIPVDSLCIPLKPPYSILSHLPTSPTPIPRSTLLKLHRLSALEPASTESEWEALKGLDGLVALVEAVQRIDTTSLQETRQADGGGVDARVRSEARPVDWACDRGQREAEEEAQGRRLLDLAERTEGAYYVVPTPENVRGKKRGGKVLEGGEEGI